MDVRRVKIFQKHKSLLPIVLVVSIVGVLIVAAWWLAPYYDDVYTLIPGVYDDQNYNQLRDEKNELIDENVEMLAEVDEKEIALDKIPMTEEGYTLIAQANGEIILVQESVQKNLLRIVELDEEMLAMSLPEVVNQYVRLSLESDKVRVDLIEMALNVSNARRDLAQLNGMRTDFDNCLSDVDWADDDEIISNQVAACSEKIPTILEQVEKMEALYEVELDLLTSYLTLLKEQWDANSSYYLAISKKDYTKANEHDLVFVERKRQISELNVGEAFGEFYEEEILPLLEEFEEIKKLETEKEERVSQWYEQNIDR